MALVITTLAVALVAGRLRGGRLADLRAIPLRGPTWLLVGLAAQMAVRAGLEPRPVLLAVAHLAPLGFLWANRRLPGLGVVTAGFALNGAVILANGAMPVSAAALHALGGTAVMGQQHRLLEPGDALPLLADVLPLPPIGVVVSPGDVAMAVGVVVLVVSSSGSTRRSAPAPRGA